MVRADAPSLSCAKYSTTTHGSLSQANCPTGYQVTGGGARIEHWNPANEWASNAPDSSVPNGNGWAVIAGPQSGDSCFRSFAVCVK